MGIFRFEGESTLPPTAAKAHRLRARYKDSEKVECAKLAKWLLDHIDAGYFTDAAVRNAFGLTVTQWSALKTKMGTLRTQYNALLAARGE